MADKDTESLFQVRAEAIRKKDRDQLLSTQVSEVPLAASDGYMSLSDIEVEVLHAHDASELERVVFVKETYKRPDASDRTAFLLYHVTNTVKGWRVFRVR